MRNRALLPAILVLPSLLASAQTSSTPPQPLTFEAVSVRMTAPYTETDIANGAGNAPWNTWPSNRFTAHHLTLKLLISLCYGVDQKHIQGGPSWLDSQHYEIDAKVDGDAMLSYVQMKPLLQHLLEERFHLAAHRKTDLVSGYALVVSKDGSKLKQGLDKPSANGYILPTEIRSPSLSMSGFASMLSSPIGFPIVDRTNLPGNYDIDLHYAPTNESGSSLPSIFTALHEQLGLKLEEQKVAVDVLFIDHAERTPTEN